MKQCPVCGDELETASFCPRDGSRLEEAERLLEGRYRLIRKIGEGGMGEVFEAEHVRLKRKVAVKILKPNVASDQDAVTRLQREAQSITGHGHPNIVDALDFGRGDDGRVYLVMEWLDGESLDARLERGLIEIPTALEIVMQTCSGLEEAHDHDLVHRDLKPANLFLTHDRHGALVVKILDFGIAKRGASENKLTATGVLIGTPNYMAPEQASGEPVDARTDVYALGVILFELLTGDVPFHADTAFVVLHQHVSRIPTVPSVAAPDRGISFALDAIVLRCLAKRPEERFDSVRSLRAALVSAQRGEAMPVARMIPTSPDTHHDVKPYRSRAPIAIALILGTALVGGTTVLMTRDWSGSTKPPSGDAPSTTRPTDAGSSTTADSTDVARIGAGRDAPVIAWTSEQRGRRTRIAASIASRLPAPGEPFDVEIRLVDPDPVIAKAITANTLTADVRLVHSSEHGATIGQAEKLVGMDGHLSVTLRSPHTGKHHIEIDLHAENRQLDHVALDVDVTAR